MTISVLGFVVSIKLFWMFYGLKKG